MPPELAVSAPPAARSHSLLEGWSRFSDLPLLLDMFAVLALAVLLAAVIAYHPVTRRRVSTLEHLEQPKTILMYGVVAAVVAIIVEVQPAMAFVIFGIGGLLRFRTLVGDAKETGRVILVTVVGLCCGLNLFVVAIPATVIGWMLIAFLEQGMAGTIRVFGVAEQGIHEATREYRTLIAGAGGAIVGEQANVVKREFSFVVRAKSSLDRAGLQARFDALPAHLRGFVVWERV